MRFVIISLPPEPLLGRIEAFRRPLNEAVDSREALRYPPHLTLRTGLVCPDDRAAEVAAAFLAHAAAFTAVPVRTDGLFFTTYGPPGAVKAMIGWTFRTSGALLALHRGLQAFTDWQKGPQGPFQPHLSVAYDDLTPGGLEEIRTRLADVEVPDYSWTLDHVALYHEKPEGWVEWDCVALKSFSSP